MRSPLLSYMHGVVRNNGADIMAANAVEDHIHLRLALKPTHAPSELVKKIKANTSRWIHGTYPDLASFAWQGGFGAYSVSESATQGVIEYIQNQEQHHRRMPFAEEVRLFLEKHGIPYDPDHYLD
jgi:REP element-mobilizing transposase RayT